MVVTDSALLNFATVSLFIVFFLIWYSEHLVHILLSGENRDKSLIKWVVYLVALLLASFVIFIMITYYGK